LVYICTALLDEATHDSQVSFLGSDTQVCAAVSYSVDVRSELLDEASNDSLMPVLGSNVERDAAIVPCLVDVCAKLVD
jgi:hypothetical protein